MCGVLAGSLSSSVVLWLGEGFVVPHGSLYLAAYDGGRHLGFDPSIPE